MRFSLSLVTFLSTSLLNESIAFAPTSTKSAIPRNIRNTSYSSSSSKVFMATDPSEIYSGPSLLDSCSQACSNSLGIDITLKPTTGGGASGGGGASVSASIDEATGKKYFIKSASVSGGGASMLRAEYLGVKEMSDTQTIKVPTPIAFGEHHGPGRDIAFCVFEYLEFCGGGSGFELGKQLATMHKQGISS